MNTTTKDSLVALLQNNLETIHNVVKNELGVDTKFEINAEQNRWNQDWWVSLEEKGDETKQQMTATPLLAQLFDDAHLWIRASHLNNLLWCGVEIKYHHNFDSGSNGCSLMRFTINLDTNEVEVLK